jgi:DNA-binding NarL/FixJ family response regulator
MTANPYARGRATELAGRRGERDALDRLADAVRKGESRALVVAGMGIEAFADRARRELAATGETARKRTAGTSSQLTAQETQIARLAGDGLSNPEIGARLFISTRTVQYHLGKVFTKLGISSRSLTASCPLTRPPSRRASPAPRPELATRAVRRRIRARRPRHDNRRR